MTQTINVYQAKTQLSALIESALSGNEVIIARSGKPVVRLVPYTQEMNERQPGAFRGKIQIPNEFDAETSIAIISNKGQITIPSTIRKELKLKVGNKVIISHSKNAISIKPQPKKNHVLTLYGSVSNPHEAISPEQALEKSKMTKATTVATQSYE